MNYDAIQYAWADIHLGPHTSDRERKWGKYQMIKHEPVQPHTTIRDQSKSHLYKLLLVAIDGSYRAITLFCRGNGNLPSH